MTAIQIIFYVFSTLAVLSGVMVIASSNPVRGALFLVLTFFAMSAVWLLLHAEFLAIILLLVYVGAVMTLFLFVVMMLQINVTKMFEGFVKYLPFALLVVAMIAGLSLIAVGPKHFGLAAMPAPALEPADYSNIKALGMVLYTVYAYPFEISAVILLAAIIAAISLSHRKPKNRKSQNVSAQIAVDPKDRLRIIKMPAEKKLKPTESGQ